MKKGLLWIIILGVSISMVAAFSFAGCKTGESTVEEVVEEEVAAEEEAAVEETPPSDVEATFTIWDTEVDNAFSASWDYAREQFKAKFPNVTLIYEQKTFEQMIETAKMILSSDEVPDVLQIDKGNSTAGAYAKEGLLTDLTAEAEARGWTDIMNPYIQQTCRYDEKGIMGSGKMYGVTNYGQFVMVYYNKDMFKQYGIEVPTTLAEFEAICDKFVAEGIIPLALGGLSGWPVEHPWYEFLLYKADRQLLDNFYQLKGEVDFQGSAFTFGAEKMVEYSTKGYFDPNFNGMSYDDANAAFVQAQYPMYITGSWQYGWFYTQITDYDWGIFLMPDKQFYLASGGDNWAVPAHAKNKDLAMEFIDLTMQKDAQTIMANAGGIPINADLTKITDQKILELNQNFMDIVEMDGLAFAPDWPLPGYVDTLVPNLQDLLAGKITVEECNEAISIPYNEYKETLE